MEGLKLIPYIALVMAIAGIVIGSAVIVQDKMQDTVDPCYNSTYSLTTTGANADKACHNNTLFGGTTDLDYSNLSKEYYSIMQGIDSEGDIAEQLPTVAIIGVMVIIISIIAGVFVYMKYFT